MHLTRKERDDKYDSNQLRTEPWRPNQDDRRASRMLWSMVSKAAERSRRHRHDNCCDPIGRSYTRLCTVHRYKESLSWCFALFTDVNVISRVCEKVASSIGFVDGPCTSRVHCRVHGRVQRPCTRPSGPNRLPTCTGREHAVSTRPACRNRVHGCVHGACPRTCTPQCTRPYKPCTRSWTRRWTRSV